MKRKASARAEPDQGRRWEPSPVPGGPGPHSFEGQGLLNGIEQCEGGFHDEEILYCVLGVPHPGAPSDGKTKHCNTSILLISVRLAHTGPGIDRT